ncbi:inactive hydroxysteroid dehydrogenase-like protein 1 [Scomber japonicus]|uniref:inactive hydroxysteroid dehydrogenase-like protein 1 n=1 Tax=Scomber japonicus TaxID=13676 RepID=UPI002306A497|nr:inactive hydroxysteroid dehydrogenase-like protein 1 [Scomber japonicus]
MAAVVDGFPLLYRELYRELARCCGLCRDCLALLGGLYVTGKILQLLRRCCSVFTVHFLPRALQNRQLARRYGDWALVHGASQPVAKAYAEELARRGVSILFVTQDHTALRDFAASLAQSYAVETVVVLADFSLDQTASKPVREALRWKDVGFLVNCVDESSAQELTETTEQGLLDSVNENVAVATLLTRLVLPGMLERSRGAVVNISAGRCCRAKPGRVMLTAASGYLDHFSRALHLEYGSRGIFVQSLTPLQISSNRRQWSADSWFVPSPEVYAHHAVSTLGVSTRTTGYWPHTLQAGLITFVPDWIWILGSRMFFRSS